MHDWLIAFGNWLQNRSWVLGYSASTWSYPFIQALHFTGLSLWIGTTAAIDLHLMGIGKRSQTSYQVSRGLIIWNWAGLAIAVTGGFLLFSISAATFIVNPAFQVKLGILIPLGLILHVVVQTKVREWTEGRETKTIAKFAGALELLLWFCVASAAVSIPLFE
jgi:hypothetical protein